MTARIIAAVVFLTLSASVLGRECSVRDEKAALDSLKNLTRWTDVHAAYKRYRHCDDGAIGEGFSDSIVHLLATRWQSLPELAALGRKNPAFRRFVLRHIDATTDLDERELVATRARDSCPASHRNLCDAIRTAAVSRE